MRFECVEIINPNTGFRARLTVGSRYKGFEVLQIEKIEAPSNRPVLSPESASLLLGTYQLLLRGPDGTEYELANNQESAGHGFCMNRALQKFDPVPGALDPLAHNSNKAEFQHPLAL